MRTVMASLVAVALTYTAAGQSLRMISSGPPHDSVASRPTGYRVR